MIREYPPILRGDAERQTAQLREYLVRLVQYLDEQLSAVAEQQPTSDEDLTAWQESVNKSLGTLKTVVGSIPQMEYGSAEAAGDIIFGKPFALTPAVFVTAGAASDVTETGFTLSAAAQWIAVGYPGRR